jgi:ABC-2 type transport system ATP-binding protein
MISCRSLTMRYGDHYALSGFTLEVPRGQICALLGPNGAGKSTTLKILAGLVKPTSGSVEIDGGMLPRDAKLITGVMPENLGLFEDLSIEEHLELSADIYGAPRERIEPLLRILSLEKGRRTYARDCSHGMRKKTSFAMALLHNPKLLLLDEPFEAVDPVSAEAMLGLLQEASGKGVTVLLTSHILSIIERLAQRVALIRAGKLVFDGSVGGESGRLQQLYFELVESPIAEKLEWLGSASS